MAWFRRGKASDTQAEAAQEKGVADGLDSTAEVSSDADAAVKVADAPSGPTGTDPARGPWDVSAVPGDDGYLKLGALWVPALEGLMLSFEMDQAQSQVTAVQVIRGDSTLQLQAFAAPRSAGLWSEIRGEIATSVQEQGSTATEEQGEFGTELVVGRDGGVMRFLGVDGPRWFLRGVISGRAAVDTAAAGPLREVFALVVVDRGSDPMGPRELLTLTLPDDGAQPDDEAPGRRASDLDPFTRGPEITEIN